jgi:hypothetical protein
LLFLPTGVFVDFAGAHMILEFEPDGSSPFGAAPVRMRMRARLMLADALAHTRLTHALLRVFPGMFISTRCQDGDLVVGRVAEAKA